jgi:branched chain amino acid efflux pump
MENSYIIISIGLLAVLSFVTRALPFALEKPLRNSERMKTIGNYLPPCIMILLAVHCMEKEHFVSYPYGIPHLIGILSIIAIHLWRRNISLSIFTGTAAFLIAKNLFQVILPPA